MTPVKLTVLMPAYNAERYISQAIESILAQTFGEFELLIVDDGSTDRTAEVVRSFNDPRIVLMSCNGLKLMVLGVPPASS